MTTPKREGGLPPGETVAMLLRNFALMTYADEDEEGAETDPDPFEVLEDFLWGWKEWAVGINEWDGLSFLIATRHVLDNETRPALEEGR